MPYVPTTLDLQRRLKLVIFGIRPNRVTSSNDIRSPEEIEIVRKRCISVFTLKTEFKQFLLIQISKIIFNVRKFDHDR